MSDRDALLALALGIGGGLVFAYFRRQDDPPDGAPLPKLFRRMPTTAPDPEATGQGASPCHLRLDATGLTADGRRVDVAGAVRRCKEAGRAELLVDKDSPASVYADLCRALAGAGVPVTVRGG